MFGKSDNKNRSAVTMKDDSSLNTIVGKGSEITGNLDARGSVRIDGVVKGEVKCSDLLTIGPEGRVEGEVKVKLLTLGGKVTGNVFASEKVELQNKSIVEGDINTKSLTVEAGAVFHGKCNMKNELKPPSSTPNQPIKEKG
ncbi:MAG: polymer-forming cytoskeletal protein [candidate division Zixibacteria bacterium]|nr:polymer-forming cytoskeletal protein [candidate division Zixibacteria bacterium]